VLAIFERRRGRLGSKISGCGQLAEVAVYFAMSGLPPEGVGIRWVPRDMNLSGDTGVEDPRATAESQRRRPSPMLN
jgi:hypothetical protein